MTDVIPGKSYGCTCVKCGKRFERPAYRTDYTSITEQRRIERMCSVCDECRTAEMANGLSRYDAIIRQAIHREKLRRRTTAADIIQDYNLRHTPKKKGKR